jgi:hypothetical protein
MVHGKAPTGTAPGPFAASYEGGRKTSYFADGREDYFLKVAEVGKAHPLKRAATSRS